MGSGGGEGERKIIFFFYKRLQAYPYIPQLFEGCFVQKDEVSNQSVADCLNLAASEDGGAERVFQMLHTFIRNSTS